MPHVKLPGYIPLHKFLSKTVLEEIERWAYVATVDTAPLHREYLRLIPEKDREERLSAIKEIGLIAQKAKRQMP